MNETAMLHNLGNLLQVVGSLAAHLIASDDDNVAAFANIVESYVCDIEREQDERGGFPNAAH